ncbi:MAG: hypothetical protein SOS98_01815 [Varibaculum sp.]|nr:hypothetical protein [Varibaculum sp.]
MNTLNTTRRGGNPQRNNKKWRLRILGAGGTIALLSSLPLTWAAADATPTATWQSLGDSTHQLNIQVSGDDTAICASDRQGLGSETIEYDTERIIPAGQAYIAGSGMLRDSDGKIRSVQVFSSEQQPSVAYLLSVALPLARQQATAGNTSEAAAVVWALHNSANRVSAVQKAGVTQAIETRAGQLLSEAAERSGPYASALRIESGELIVEPVSAGSGTPMTGFPVTLTLNGALFNNGERIRTVSSTAETQRFPLILPNAGTVKATVSVSSLPAIDYRVWESRTMQDMLLAGASSSVSAETEFDVDEPPAGEQEPPGTDCPETEPTQPEAPLQPLEPQEPLREPTQATDIAPPSSVNALPAASETPVSDSVDVPVETEEPAEKREPTGTDQAETEVEAAGAESAADLLPAGSPESQRTGSAEKTPARLAQTGARVSQVAGAALLAMAAGAYILRRRQS